MVHKILSFFSKDFSHFDSLINILFNEEKNELVTIGVGNNINSLVYGIGYLPVINEQDVPKKL